MRQSKSFRLQSFLSAEFIRYLISGGLVTLLNLLVFTLLNRWLGLSRWYLSNLPAIVLSILFAYWLNRRFVFRSTRPWQREILSFIGSRLLISLIFEYLALWLLINQWQWTAALSFGGVELPWAKILAQGAVVIGNYLVGKLWIFTAEGEV